MRITSTRVWNRAERRDEQSNQVKAPMEQLREAIVRAISNQQNVADEKMNTENVVEGNAAGSASKNANENVNEHASENVNEHASENVNEHASENVNEHASENVNEHASENVNERASDSVNEKASEQSKENANVLETSEPAVRQEPSVPKLQDTSGLEDFVKAELERGTSAEHIDTQERSEPEAEPAAPLVKKSLDHHVKKEAHEDEVRRNTVALDTPAVLPDFLNRENEMNGHLASSVRVDEPARFADAERSAPSGDHQKRNDIESNPASSGGPVERDSASAGSTSNGGAGLDFSSVAAAAKRTADEAARTLEKIGSRDGEDAPIKRNSVPQTPLIPRIAQVHLFGPMSHDASISKRGGSTTSTESTASSTTEDAPVTDRDLGPQIEPREREVPDTTPSSETSAESRTAETKDENEKRETLQAAEIDDETSNSETFERSVEDDIVELEAEAETDQRSAQNDISVEESDEEALERSDQIDVSDVDSEPEASERSIQADEISELQSEAEPESSERSLQGKDSDLDETAEADTSVRSVEDIPEPESRNLESSKIMASNNSPNNLLSDNKLNAEKISASQVQSLAMPLVKRVGELMKKVENTSPNLNMHDALKRGTSTLPNPSEVAKKSEVTIPTEKIPNSKAENDIQRELDSKYNDNNEAIERFTSDNIGRVKENNKFDIYSDNLKRLSNKLSDFSKRATELDKSSKSKPNERDASDNSTEERSKELSASEKRRKERDIDNKLLKNLLKKQSNNLFLRQIGPNKRQTILPRVLLNSRKYNSDQFS